MIESFTPNLLNTKNESYLLYITSCECRHIFARLPY